MSIRKLAVAVAVGCAFVLSGVAYAQEAEENEEAVEEVEEEEVAPPAPVAAPVAPAPAPVVEAAPAPAPAAPAAKPETKIDLYGAVQYRFRDRLHSLTDTLDKSGGTNNYQNLFSWRAGLKAKVHDQLALQIQIGNDWGAGEAVNWSNNNTPSGRILNLSGAPFSIKDRTGTVVVDDSTSYPFTYADTGAVYGLNGFQNLYVHIASFKWNQGAFFVEGGVINLPSNGTLDLLERSINLGHYGEAAFQGWSTEVNASLLGLKVGVPILKDDVKLGLELFQTIIDQREQSLAAKDDIPANPSSPMFVVTLPVEAAALKLTPELTYILNRNYNTTTEQGDDEILFGASASYAVNKEISVSLLGGYGTVSNENSRVGAYSSNVRSGAYNDSISKTRASYTSVGTLLGVGTAIKAGPGTIQFDFKYNSAVNSATDATTDNTKYDYTYADIRYAYKPVDKFTITPRYRNYYRTFPPKGTANASRMENRLELIFEGQF